MCSSHSHGKCKRAWPQGQHPRVYPKMLGAVCWVLGDWVLGAGVLGTHAQASTSTIHGHGHATCYFYFAQHLNNVKIGSSTLSLEIKYL